MGIRKGIGGGSRGYTDDIGLFVGGGRQPPGEAGLLWIFAPTRVEEGDKEGIFEGIEHTHTWLYPRHRNSTAAQGDLLSEGNDSNQSSASLVVSLFKE